MKIAIYHIAYRLGMHPNELAKVVYDGEVTGEVLGNPQSRESWVDLLSLRNYIEWIYEKEKLSEMSYLRALRHIDREIDKQK